MDTAILVGLWVMWLFGAFLAGDRLARREYGKAVCNLAEALIILGAISLINGWV